MILDGGITPRTDDWTFPADPWKLFRNYNASAPRWIGVIVGMILNLASSDGMNSIGPGMAAATVTILYGYTSGYLIEAGLEK